MVLKTVCATIFGEFLDYLRNLLKDQVYVALAYMTGILSIKMYDSHSALNMFQEYSMTNLDMFTHYTVNWYLCLASLLQKAAD